MIMTTPTTSPRYYNPTWNSSLFLYKLLSQVNPKSLPDISPNNACLRLSYLG